MRAALTEVRKRQVWEEEDRMEAGEFDTTKFFHLHDVDGDGRYWCSNHNDGRCQNLKSDRLIFS